MALNNFALASSPCNDINELFDDFKFIKSNQKINYLNVACGFDIESTSFYYNDNLKDTRVKQPMIKNGKHLEPDDSYYKAGLMYAYVFGINGKYIRGRTWDEFISQIKQLHEHYATNLENRIIIYVHNLSFEFQWFRKKFEWHKIFALDERQIVYALTEDGIEFRCSYVLTNYSLATVGKHCVKYPVQKMVGDLDYKKLRSPITPLTDVEWNYVDHDVLVLMSYIQQTIEYEHNNITNIPLTATGYVRRYCRNNCLYDAGKSHTKSTKYLKYRNIIKSLTITSIEEYNQCKRALIGGHSHGNPLWIGQIFKDVKSVDFTSSYPYVMCSEKYPMSKGKRIKIQSKEDFEFYINNYCCIFDISFYNIESITPFEHFIPASKCFNKTNFILDNGKLVKADKITITLTSVDFKTISKFYKWDEIGISNFRYYMMGYLPKDFILSILMLYVDKTKLKGISESYIEYMRKKGDLNSTYGMAVTDICRDDILYENNTWMKSICDYEKVLNKYNKSKNRFLFYLWGVFETAYAKKNLADGIIELGMDYLYSDTDSLKFINWNKHKEFFINYNKGVKDKLLKMINFYHLDPALIEPVNIDGKKCLLGVYDLNDANYRRFKCLGSKRYMVQYWDKSYSFTVAGCSKTKAVPYLLGIAQKQHKNPLDLFDDQMYIPAEYTSKNTHTYIDYENTGVFTDMNGIKYKFKEESAMHLEECDFTLSLTSNFIDYIFGLRGVL